MLFVLGALFVRRTDVLVGPKWTSGVFMVFRVVFVLGDIPVTLLSMISLPEPYVPPISPRSVNHLVVPTKMESGPMDSL